MRRKSAHGNRSVGRRLKKSPNGRPDHRLHRREWAERTAPPLPYLGAKGETPVLQYHFNWKTLSAMAGITSWNFYFRLFPGAIRSPQVILFPHPFTAPHTRQIADRLGRAGGASQRGGVGVHSTTARAALDRVPARLRPGTESGRVCVVLLEATRVAQFLSGQLRPVEPTCPPGAPPDAPSPNPGLRLLATSGTISSVTILCKLQ